MHLSLRAKFYLLVSVLVFAVGGVLSSYFVRQLRDTVHSGLEQRARALAGNLARNSEYGVLLRSRELLEGPIRSLLVDDMILGVAVADMEGNLLARIGRPGQTLPDTIAPSESHEVRTVSVPGRSMFEVEAPVYTGEAQAATGGLAGAKGTPASRRRIGTAYLLVSYAEAETAAHRLSLTALVITGIMVGVCLLGGIFFVRRIVNPLVALEAGTRRLGQGELNFRVSVRGRDEIGRLATSFNAMASELQKNRQALDGHNRNLEQKVAEKTQILSLANRRLEEMNRLKSEFLANMSHELRTPLNAILGFTDLMIDGQVGTINAQQERYLQTVYTSGQHLLSLINSILDLSKIEAGKMELFPEEFYVRDVVDFSLSLVGPLASRKKVTLEKAVAVDVKTLIADQTKVQQILHNLLSNAVKFTPENGRVGVVVTQDQHGVLFAIADSGVGIAPEDQRRIFKAFTQADASYTRRFEGTGLGLALVDHYVRMHRGKVWVESEVGKGSTFYVRLPRKEAPGTTTAASSKLGAVQGDTVLIVEDDPVAQRILGHYLEQAGCSICFASSVRDAKKAVKEHRPSLITLDIMLDGESGWDLLTELKGDPKTAEIPVIVISAVNERGIGYAFGAEDYLVKPVSRDQLVMRLAAMGLVRRDGQRPAEVLIIDDHEEARLLLREILEGEKMSVIEASTGKEGIEAARITVPDLILLDLMMPEVSGFEVLKELRSNPETREVPVIVVTAKDLTPEETALLNGHIQALVQKASLSVEEFAQEVHRVLQASGRPQEVVHA